MTNAQKRELRQCMREGDRRSDQAIADDVECSVGTVKKYRKAFAVKD